MEMKSNKPQSLAIAFNIQKKNRAKKMYDGGRVKRHNDENFDNEGMPTIDSYYEGGKIRGDEDEREAEIAHRKDHDDLRDQFMVDVDHLSEGGMASDDKLNEKISRQSKMDDEDNAKYEGMDDIDTFADGGMAYDGHMDEERSIADEIMRKRHMMKKMADGGQVDLSRNADEDFNEEDQMSYDALRKENYSESEGLEKLDQPMDSNMKGRDLPDEDEHDMVDQVRRKMKAKRGY